MYLHLLLRYTEVITKYHTFGGYFMTTTNHPFPLHTWELLRTVNINTIANHTERRVHIFNPLACTIIKRSQIQCGCFRNLFFCCFIYVTLILVPIECIINMIILSQNMFYEPNLPIKIGVDVTSWSMNWPKWVKATVNVLLLGWFIPPSWTLLLMSRGLGSGLPLTLWIRGTNPRFCPRKTKASNKNIFNLVCMSVITNKIKAISLIF